ncbi:esterase-like activity of phytase family protein [Oleisolibacter albus]|uniref:esterase-like activity of phytase family protein n=1 Tax=Oleisolibacter albus TaxID=2171757 RepID=UPI000DF21E40|nr:esterase-like activity of phytase family protein [Oleisolibacter albus]
MRLPRLRCQSRRCFRPLPLLLLLGLPLLSACAASAPRPGGWSVPVALSEEPGAGERAGSLLYRGGLHLEHDDAAFGGLSSLRVSPDGTQFVAISDRAQVVRGRLGYGADGRLAAASDLRIAPLPLDRERNGVTSSDSEGLALLGAWPGQGWVVSFERDHRLLRYGADLAGAPTRLDGPDGLAGLGFNEGVETLTSWDDGRLLLIVEGEEAGLHRGWLGRPGGWQPFRYRARPSFLPVDATRLPDGDLVVLERRASWTGGWGSRIVRVAAADLKRAVAADGVVEGVELGRLGPPGIADNFEGIDARALPDGRVLLYLVSDNNFSGLQRTLLLMFELPKE